MWPFSRKHTLLDSGVFEGFTDCHTHLLPGVDDGVRTLDESLAILERYEQLGMKSVWLTPHIMEDIPNTPDDLKDRFDALCCAYRGRLELHLGAENMIDNLFEHRLESGEILPMGSGGWSLLVETSYFSPPFGFYETLEKIKSKGYYPVLAHPERYSYMSGRDYVRLKSMGVRFQLNLFSLTGHYGGDVRRVAAGLLKKGFYEFAGTDVHTISSIDSCLKARMAGSLPPSFKDL